MSIILSQLAGITYSFDAVLVNALTTDEFVQQFGS
jgi:hypothetical protein